MALYTYPETQGGWQKYTGNPVLGNEELGTCFDVFMLQEEDGLRMYFSWRPQKSLAVSLSADGVHWSDPRIILEPRLETAWEDDLNRNCIVRVGDDYHMWYTGQARGGSYIGYAVSKDGYDWTRIGDEPVLIPEIYWEKRSVMCPDVIWDPEEHIFKMWYSAGETIEPNAIGYATSTDGVNWKKHRANPIHVSQSSSLCEHERVGACQVIKDADGYTMFYIGYEDIETARICIARSKDGVTGWERNPNNPIVSPTEGSWDAHACYKPFALYDDEKDLWTLYYNGRREQPEYIGIVTKQGKDLGFSDK
jgi:predicted GH43/DUF377 family glycosyl hydrolase